MMTNEEKLTALYDKLTAEQDAYRDWLKNQPPEEILNHTYEYTVRENIVMAMKDLKLSNTQADALLFSPSPLSDVYALFLKFETGYVDVIRDAVESCADTIIQRHREKGPLLLYYHDANYARKMANWIFTVYPIGQILLVRKLLKQQSITAIERTVWTPKGQPRWSAALDRSVWNMCLL